MPRPESGRLNHQLAKHFCGSTLMKGWIPDQLLQYDKLSAGGSLVDLCRMLFWILLPASGGCPLVMYCKLILLYIAKANLFNIPII